MSTTPLYLYKGSNLLVSLARCEKWFSDFLTLLEFSSAEQLYPRCIIVTSYSDVMHTCNVLGLDSNISFSFVEEKKKVYSYLSNFHKNET